MKYLSNFFCGVSVTLTAAVTLKFDWIGVLAATTAFMLGAVFHYSATAKEK